MAYKEFLRIASCWTCLYRDLYQIHSIGSTKQKKCYCTITKRFGNLERANYCEHYEYVQLSNPVGENGILIKNRQPLDYRTPIQWEYVGRKIKSDAIGKQMYASRQSKKIFTYYLIEETEEITSDNVEKSCLTCSYIGNNKFCEIAGDYVGKINLCSEWTSKY